MKRSLMPYTPWHTFHAAHLKAGASLPSPLPGALAPWEAHQLQKPPSSHAPLLFPKALLSSCAPKLTLLHVGRADRACAAANIP